MNSNSRSFTLSSFIHKFDHALYHLSRGNARHKIATDANRSSINNRLLFDGYECIL